MKPRIASFGQLQELFRAAEAATGPQPAEGASDCAAAASARPQHNCLQPPAQPERPLLRHNSLQLQLSGGLAQQHSLGLLERRALGEQTRLRVGLPARGGSKTFSISSGLGSETDLTGTLTAAASPRPLQPYGEAVASLLARRCSKAQRMVAELQRPVFSVQEGGERPALPAAALRFCKVRGWSGGQGGWGWWGVEGAVWPGVACRCVAAAPRWVRLCASALAAAGKCTLCHLPPAGSICSAPHPSNHRAWRL